MNQVSPCRTDLHPRHEVVGVERGQSRNLVIFAALAGLLAAPFAASAARLDFAPGTAGAWTPYLKSPAVVATADGLAFPRAVCAGRRPRRVGQGGHLISAAVAELDVACPAPDAVRALGLYFKSGAGWYVANKPLAGPALYTLVFNKSDFTNEGKPAGWNRIDGIRLSPWKGARAARRAGLRRLATVEGSALVVVRGTTPPRRRRVRAVAEKPPRASAAC